MIGMFQLVYEDWLVNQAVEQEDFETMDGLRNVSNHGNDTLFLPLVKMMKASPAKTIENRVGESITNHFSMLG